MNNTRAEGSPMRVLVAGEDEGIRREIVPFLRGAGHQVEEVPDAPSAKSRVEGAGCDVALVDSRVLDGQRTSFIGRARIDDKGVAVVLITDRPEADAGLDALRLGATDYLRRPVSKLELQDVIRKADRATRSRRQALSDASAGVPETYGPAACPAACLVGRSPAMARVREQVHAAVETNCRTVLIQGETGTGKEVVAHELHVAATKAGDPFVAVSCPALPETLVESELFGHVKGSFTGAVSDKAGCFETASGGTLFLDEIADLSLPAQAKLLRVLETRSVKRVGGTREAAVDVRLIAATNSPLEDLVAKQRFRQDLYFRLNVFNIVIPPLRERKEDVLPLAQHFVRTEFAGRGIAIDGFTPRAEELLLSHDYPGNVRELKNIVERAAITCRKGMIRAEHIYLPGRAPTGSILPPSTVLPEREQILLALERARWNRQRAAAELGVPYSTLRYKIKKYGIA
ncbi:MAG: sigma-54-dependent Fis family transcriptional regulator [Deltaproteobacteria bacterium]|nr:sigma-54-dependent Fis family transcriptional regulator [Deltaproteobacteria bacterium]